MKNINCEQWLPSICKKKNDLRRITICIAHLYSTNVLNRLLRNMAINNLLIYTLSFLYISSSGSANTQLLDVSAPGHSPWI